MMTQLRYLNKINLYIKKFAVATVYQFFLSYNRNRDNTNYLVIVRSPSFTHERSVTWIKFGNEETLDANVLD